VKTKTLSIGVLLFLNYSLYAQLQCGTESTTNTTYQRNAAKSYSVRSLDGVNFCVNVYFHILRNDAGQTSIPSYYTGAMLDKLNEDYEQYNISFKSLGTGYINNSAYTNDGVGVYGGNIDQLFDTNDHPNAIDIYIAEKSDWAGRADGVLSKDFVIHKDYAITGIVSHEMGHCLNLYHTHELQFGRELPNGSNCQTAGDLICDTPADPNLNSHHSKLDSNCNTTQPINDNNGVTYYPDTKNYMSYTTPDCMQRFSDGQVRKMKDAMLNAPILQDVLTCCSTEPITLSQVDEICYSISRTFNLDNLCYNTQTTWQTSNNLQIIDQDDFSITVKAINASVSGQGWIKATFNNFSQQVTQYVQVGVPNYYLQTGNIESQFVDIFYQRWTRLFIHGVTEQNGWEWEVDYSYVRPSDTQSILIYPRVFGPIYARVRRENQCGKGPWLTEYFEVIQSGGHKILR
jgi:hypothetical protein